MSTREFVDCGIDATIKKYINHTHRVASTASAKETVSFDDASHRISPGEGLTGVRTFVRECVLLWRTGRYVGEGSVKSFFAMAHRNKLFLITPICYETASMFALDNAT